ncbi:MAG: D-glycerate dehydrogenase [Conexivisphaerales archaeon]|nr:D-glycerate dehydrogenase [Conexivisphaerales archaeon]
MISEMRSSQGGTKPRVILTFSLPREWLGALPEEVDLVQRESSEISPRNWLLKEVGSADGLLCSLADRIDEEVLRRASMLRIISTYSVGYDHIDVKAARARGIRVGYTPEVLTDSTADLVMALLLAVARRVAEGDRLVRSGGWREPWSATFMLGADVHGKTLGIVGMGRIGRAVARRARGFDMRVLYHSRTPKDGVDAEYVSLESLLAESDFVVLAVDLNPDTYHMVDYGFLRRMRRSAFLINASRGKVVAEDDLVRALREGVIAGAALDVYEEEPLDADHPLTRMENVVLTPHLGSATVDTRRRMAEVAVENLMRGLRGEPLLHEVPAGRE